MSPQREILPLVSQRVLREHPGCSIVLIGSVAREEERPDDSDLDLNVFFPTEPVPSSWINADNRWQLQVKKTICGVRVDVAWETIDYLEQELTTERPFWQRSLWILSFGEIVHDPSNRIEPCLQIARDWTKRNAEQCDKLEADFRNAKAEQLARRSRK